MVGKVSAFTKSSWRRILGSLGRFLSIVLISAVGIGFFGGVNGTGGAMLKSAQTLFSEQELSDIRLISPLGFKESSIREIAANPAVEQVDQVFFTDLYIPQKERNAVVRFMSLAEAGELNQLYLVEGRMPEADNEVVVDLSARKHFGLEIGSVVKWEVPGSRSGGISLDELTQAFEEAASQDKEGEEPDSGEEDGDLEPSESKAPRSQNPLDLPEPKAGQSAGVTVGQFGLEKILPQVANASAEQPEEEVNGEFEFELPPALKELAEFDAAELERRFSIEEQDPEVQAVLNTKAEDILADENDALIQLAKAMGDRDLKHESYTIVGFVNSPLYITFQRDMSSLGAGSVDFNAYVRKTEFKLADPPLLAIRVKGTTDLNPFGKQYSRKIRKVVDDFTELGTAELSRRTSDIRNSLESKKELLERATEVSHDILEAGEAEIERLSKLFEEAAPELKKLEKELGTKIESGENELAGGKEKISDARMQYQSGMLQYQEAKTMYEIKGLELSMAETQLGFAQQALNLVQGEINSLQPLINQLDQDIQIVNYKITVLENIAYSIAPGPIHPAQWTEIINQIAAVDADLAQAIAAMNPYDPNAGGLLKQSLANAITASRLIRGQSMAVYNYHRMRLDAFFNRVASAEQEVQSKQAMVDEGRAAWEAGKSQLDAAKAELNAASSQISEGEKQIAEHEMKLSQGKDRLTRELLTASLKLENGEQQLNAARQRFIAEKTEAMRKIELADEAIAEAEQLILELPSGWFVFDRNDNPGYESFQSDVDRISAVARVFPVFLFLVAALVCLTTMTRLIEEDRTEIGALKALGYDSRVIAKRYLRYAFLATMAGAILGGIFGPLIFPTAIMNSYSSLYQSVNFQIDFDLRFVLLATVLQLFFTLAASLAAIKTSLRETPAALLQPKAPKPGKRIFLEKIPFLWKRFSFTQKLTARNIFRYKARMAMIMAGISGCTALLLAAFGIHNSLYDMRDKQFDELWRMDGMAILSSSGIHEGEKVLSEITSVPGLAHVLPVSYETLVIEPNRDSKQGQKSRPTSLTLLVAEDDARFKELFVLRKARGKAAIDLPAEGLVLTRKIAEEQGYEVGDRVVFKDSSGRRYTAILKETTENYIQHYAYMSPRAYSRMSYKQAEFNSVYYSYVKDLEQSDRDTAATDILAKDHVLSVKTMSSLKTEVTDMISSIGAVVSVLVLTAATLAFIVLYNLSNINVTERVREIATFRVLGFHELEVSTYIFRENTILTGMGAALGLILGVILHRFIIQTMEVDIITFGREIHFLSYFLAVVLTLLFAQIVNFVMYFKIRKINMVEALKAGE
ncbi:MAG: FtsX-like permease family protein [Eubacteriales bacterium]|nr:FtsX-like permease family protein [Eubacteriales bacterium]